MNPHTRRRQILNLVRLPIPPLPHVGSILSGIDHKFIIGCPAVQWYQPGIPLNLSGELSYFESSSPSITKAFPIGPNSMPEAT